MKIRASFLPMAATCGASIDGMRTESADNEPARLGQGGHKAMAGHIVGKDVDLAGIAREFRVDADELRMLVSMNLRLWRSVADKFPKPSVEVPLALEGDVTLTGHVDVLDASGAVLQVADHKTGRKDSNHDDQLRGYCLLALQEYPRATHATGYTLVVREGIIDKHTYGRGELSNWWAEFARNLPGRRQVFAPGPHCLHCPRSLDCPAKTALIRQAVMTIGDWESDAITTEAIRKTYDAVKLVEDACSNARDAIRLVVKEKGGKLPLGDGRQLEIQERQLRRLVPETAFPILAAQFGTNATLGCCTIGKGKVEELAKENAARGQKGAAAKAIIEELDSVGAIEIEVSERLECKRDPSTIGSNKPAGVLAEG